MIRLLVVDDHTMMRKLLVEEIAEIDDMEAVGDMSTGEEALSRLMQIRPDIVLMDISLPGKDGIEIAAEMRARGIETPVLCLTMHLNTHIMKRAMRAGVNGYALKHDTFEDLVQAIRTVAAGGTFVSPALMPQGEPDEDRDALADSDVLKSLSPRERQIVTLVAAGRTTSDIARHLSISVRTVDFHRRNIADKTGLRRIADITKFAVRTGLALEL